MGFSGLPSCCLQSGQHALDRGWLMVAQSPSSLCCPRPETQAEREGRGHTEQFRAFHGSGAEKGLTGVGEEADGAVHTSSTQSLRTLMRGAGLPPAPHIVPPTAASLEHCV